MWHDTPQAHQYQFQTLDRCHCKQGRHTAVQLCVCRPSQRLLGTVQSANAIGYCSVSCCHTCSMGVMPVPAAAAAQAHSQRVTPSADPSQSHRTWCFLTCQATGSKVGHTHTTGCLATLRTVSFTNVPLALMRAHPGASVPHLLPPCRSPSCCWLCKGTLGLVP